MKTVVEREHSQIIAKHLQTLWYWQLTPTRMNGDTVVVFMFTLQQFSKFNGPCQMGILCYPSKLVKVQGCWPSGNSGPGCERLSLEQEICRKLLYEQERISSKVQISKIGVTQRKWNLQIFGKGCDLSKFWIDFCDPLFKKGKNNAEKETSFFFRESIIFQRVE